MGPDAMDEEIVRADRRWRRRLMLILAVMVLTGILLIGWGVPALDAFLDTADSTTIRRGMDLFMAVMALLVILPAGRLWQVGQRVIRTAQYPPPGVRVLRDTRRLGGAAACRRGRAMMITAAALVLLVLGVCAAFHVLLARLVIDA